MSSRIKLYLGFMALITLFSVLTLFNSLGNSPPTFLKPLTGSVLEAVDTDWDKDGLANKDESYWNTGPNNPDTDGDGFLDGEEVASGHDPMKPGPDDLLPSSTVNITDKVSNLMTAGFYAGDLSADADPEVYNKALADISTEALIDGEQALNSNNIPSVEITFSSNSKRAQEEYLKDLGAIVQDIWGEVVSEPRLVTDGFANFYSDNSQSADRSRERFSLKTAYYREKIAEINTLPVPPAWLPIHQKLLSGLKTLAINHQALSQTNEDPIKSIFAVNNLVSLYQEIPPLLISIMQKIKENNLTPPNGELWELFDSLIDGF